MRNSRVVIVGGGVAGLATAWHLSRLGARDVVVVERERELGTQATAQNAAILRTAIDDEAVRALAQRGAEFLARPPRNFALRPLLDARGVLILARGEPAWATASDGGCARISTARARDRVPALPPDLGPAWFFQSEGLVDVEALVAGFTAGARAAGVQFRLGARVRVLCERGRGVELDDGTVIESETTVVAAGAWAARLARSAGSRVALTPTRRHLLVTGPDPRVDPRQPVVWSDDDQFYARPSAGGLMLCPCDEGEVDPDRLCASSEAIASTRAKARSVLPGYEPQPVARLWAGLRAHAHDRRFVLGRDPDVPGLVWAAGLGGHGITCASAAGEVAAAAVLDHPLPRELTAPSAPDRFARERMRVP